MNAERAASKRRSYVSLSLIETSEQTQHTNTNKHAQKRVATATEYTRVCRISFFFLSTVYNIPGKNIGSGYVDTSLCWSHFLSKRHLDLPHSPSGYIYISLISSFPPFLSFLLWPGVLDTTLATLRIGRRFPFLNFFFALFSHISLYCFLARAWLHCSGFACFYMSFVCY